ncbi:MAG: hypothetical protein IT219_04675 [Bacteroidales bacterium]|nr:hypothetical protein [Bacteroidales bacterium]
MTEIQKGKRPNNALISRRDQKFSSQDETKDQKPSAPFPRLNTTEF